MRADRLLSMMMLLQTRGQLTARQLAAELETSVRTVYRDLEALSMAGVPVYAEAGPGGGCGLLESYRTQLTGLREEEVRALFMLSVPAALGDLGFGAELKAALLKLNAALPPSRQGEATWIRQRVHLDWEPWETTQQPAPHLRAIQHAVWEDRQITVTYWLEGGVFRAPLERTVDPYGLVAKAGAWYLVCAAGAQTRVFRLLDLAAVQVEGTAFVRPAGFDLATFWQGWCATAAAQRQCYPVVVRIAPAMLTELPLVLGDWVRPQLLHAGPPDAEGWVKVTLEFDSLYAARAQLLALGGGCEVLAPEALRLSLVDFAQQIVERHHLDKAMAVC